MKIANKINLSFSIVVVVLVGISLVTFYAIAKSNLEKAIYAHLSTTAQSRAHHVETCLEEDKTKIKLLAESDLIEDTVEEIIHNGPNSKETPQDLSLILKDFAKAKKEPHELLILNPDGKVIASTDEEDVGADEPTEAHFLGGKDEAYIRDTHHSESGEHEFSVSAPIRDDNTKELLGILIGRFSMSDLNRITTERTGLGETGELYIVNKYGYMITPSRFNEDTFLKQKVDTVNFRKCLMHKGEKHVLSQEKIVSVFPDYRGVMVLGAHEHLPEMQWSLLAEIDEKEALAPLATIKLIFIIILCAVPVTVWAVGMLVSRAITAPIHKLHRGTEIIGEGDLDYKVGTDAKDEIGQLSRAFDKMTIDLKGTTTSIDNLNKEITERKNIEKELRQYDHIVSSSTDMMALLDKRFVYIAANASYLEAFKKTPDEVIGHTASEVFGKEFFETVIKPNADRCLSGEKVSYQEWFDFPAYGPRYMDVNYSPYIDINNEVSGFVVNARNITERKKAEEKINEQNEFLSLIIESLQHPFYVVNANDYTIILANSAALTGPVPEGLTCYSLTHKQDRPCKAPEHICPLDEVKKTKQPLIVEHKHYDKEDNQRDMEVHAYPIFDKQGNLIQMIEYSLDITERKQAEKTLEFAYAELEKANKELKETQSQLVQNEKLASIGQLAAGIAHEINTPVGFVASNFQTLESYIDKIEEMLKMYDKLIVEIEASGKTELLNQTHAIAKSRDDMKMDFILGDIQELFADSREGVARVTNIVQNLRDFSRIDLPGSLDEYNINDGIETTLIVAKNEIKYDANIKTDFSELPSILCHAGQINQVLLNILINAAQAIKSRQGDDMGAITIKTYATDEQVVCEISDNGCGIAPENLSKVFDPFFTTKPTGKGTGLGLSVSYDIIVNKHNGEILVDSTVGEGTKFTIKLPIKRKNPDYEEAKENSGKKNSVICGR